MAAVVVAIALALAFLLVGDEPSMTPAFERGAGGEISFEGSPDTWCGPFGGVGPTPLPDETLYVLHGRVTARQSPAWALRAVVDDIEVGRTYSLPSPYGDDVEKPAGFALYVRDGGTVEASSTSERSRGTLRFEELSCERGETIEFRISGTIGSEFLDGEPVHAEGTFRDVVGTRPEGLPEGIP